MSYGGWGKYVSVAERKAKAQKKIKAMQKKGQQLQPVEISGRLIARSFWGKAWCEHLEQFSDYETRLPRGRTYVRNGSVFHLAISAGRIDALVMGSEKYRISVTIDALPKAKWQALKKRCAGSIGSLLELLQGKLSTEVMQAVTDTEQGLFPAPAEISLACDCPDWAELCKHLAAVLYGVGARLDESPELLFLLRQVNHEDLIDTQVELPASSVGESLSGDLADIFGIDLDDSPLPVAVPTPAVTSKMKPKARAKAKAKAGGKVILGAKTAAGAKGKKLRSKKDRAEKAEPRIKTSGLSAAELADLVFSAELLVAFRERLTLSQDDFAALVGKSPSTVRKWESHSGPIKLQYASRAALQLAFQMSAKDVRRKLAGDA